MKSKTKIISVSASCSHCHVHIVWSRRTIFHIEVLFSYMDLLLLISNPKHISPSQPHPPTPQGPTLPMRKQNSQLTWHTEAILKAKMVLKILTNQIWQHQSRYAIIKEYDNTLEIESKMLHSGCGEQQDLEFLECWHNLYGDYLESAFLGASASQSHCSTHAYHLHYYNIMSSLHDWTLTNLQICTIS